MISPPRHETELYERLRDASRPGSRPETEVRLQFQAAGALAARNSYSLQETMSAALNMLIDDEYGNLGARSDSVSMALSAIADGYSSAQLSRFPVGPVRDTIDSPLISRLNALHGISRAATITTSATEYLRKSIDIIHDVTAADALTVFVFDRPTNSLTLAGQYGFDPALVGTMSIRGSRGIIGRVISEGKAVFAGRVREHPEWFPSPRLQDEIYQAQASIPMKLANPDRMVGVLSLWTLEINSSAKTSGCF